MSTGQTIQSVLMFLVFLAWAGMLVRAVTVWRHRAQADGDGVMAQAGQWFRAPEDRSERNTFLFLTFVLAVMLLTTATLG
jgi:hypothetical protein